MKILRSTDMLHPKLNECVIRIQKDVIQKYNVPMKLFETGRIHDRHQRLINSGKKKDLLSRHLFDSDNNPPLYCTALDYVFYDRKWSWNLRNPTVLQWYKLFGHLVLDSCAELEWRGLSRNNIDYTHFQLKESVIINEMGNVPCVLPI